MNDKIAGTLRLAAAAAVVVALTAAGYFNRSPWIVVLAAPLLTVLYALGKWLQWRTAWRLGGMKAVTLAFLTTLPIQAVLGGFLYLVGLGLARLFAGSAPIAPFGSGDVLAAGLVFLIGLVFSLSISRLEDGAFSSLSALQEATGNAWQTDKEDREMELDIEPTPLSSETFFQGPGNWRPDVTRDALEGRGKIIEKQPEGASEGMISETEARLGFRLPETLRGLYRIMNGGYVGTLYVPLKAQPQPVYEDWRGAFSIDYSSLCPLNKLRTVYDHYQDFTDDDEDVPANARQLVVLQARYGDMTLLDYSGGPEPRVLLADFDKGDDPVDIELEDFDAFFKALRRVKEEGDRPFDREKFRSLPLGTLPEANRPAVFWGNDPHPFFNIAKSRGDGSEPKAKADDALIADTETRLGFGLPDSVKVFWKAKNGGSVMYRYIDIRLSDGSESDMTAFEELLPLEYIATLSELSSRITFPPGDVPWHEKVSGADKLVVLDAKRGHMVLLDYRNGKEPALLIIEDFEKSGIENATVFESFDTFAGQLRKFQRR